MSVVFALCIPACGLSELKVNSGTGEDRPEESDRCTRLKKKKSRPSSGLLLHTHTKITEAQLTVSWICRLHGGKSTTEVEVLSLATLPVGRMWSRLFSGIQAGLRSVLEKFQGTDANGNRLTVSGENSAAESLL